ncbi:MAG TPA: glycosyltransferase family 39 protein [Chloroflexota bacterium]|nr:glycosyltransferase family 39 protein [Chloroflexota bacterium]
MRILAVVLLGFALRLLGLNGLGDLEFDEIVSVRYATLPASELLPRLSGALFEHPPLYYLMLGGWRAMAGESDVLARVFSVLPGTISISLVYAAGRRLFGVTAGLTAALLMAVSPLPVFYSREARMYGPVACLIIASFWLFLRAADKDRGTGHWLAYCLIGVATSLVHYAGLLIMLAQPLSTLLLPPFSRRRLRPLLVTTLGIALVAVSWMAGSSGVRGSLPALELANLLAAPGALAQTWRELAGGPEMEGWRTTVSAIALALLLAIGLAASWRAFAVLAPSLLFGFLALLVAVALAKPAQARYLIPVVPFVYLGTAAAVALRPRLGVPLMAVAIVFGALPFWVTYYGGYRRADYSEITRRIASLERSDDAILLTGPWQAWYFDYYYPTAGGQLLHRVLPENAPPALDPARARLQLETLTASRHRLWFVQAGLAQADPTNFVERWLRDNAWPALRESHDNAVLTLYALQPPEVHRPLRPTDFGGALRLASGWIDGEEVASGDVVRLWLEFEALRPLNEVYRASLRLVGADGQRLVSDFDLTGIAGDDRRDLAWRQGDRVTLRRGIWVPVSANSQPYEARLVVYEAATQVPLSPTVDAVGPGGEAPIGGLYVTQTRAALPAPPSSYESVDRTFGGGDDFDSLHLTGLRWHQSNPSAAPLAMDLLWQLDGLSGTIHRSRLVLTDARGQVWLDESRPLFAGVFNMHDWRTGETIGERRTVDVTSLPDGQYVLSVRLYDDRGRALPAQVRVMQNGEAGQAGTVELHQFTLPYRRPFLQRAQGVLSRLFGRLG